MRHTVENLAQGNNSTLMLTATPRHGANAITFQFRDYSFEEFQQFCELMQPKHIQLNTIQQGKGFKIYFGLDKRRCFFGQGENFTQALIGLVQDMHYRIEA